VDHPCQLFHNVFPSFKLPAITDSTRNSLDSARSFLFPFVLFSFVEENDYEKRYTSQSSLLVNNLLLLCKQDAPTEEQVILDSMTGWGMDVIEPKLPHYPLKNVLPLPSVVSVGKWILNAIACLNVRISSLPQFVGPLGFCKHS
jgi:hypothetical protein